MGQYFLTFGIVTGLCFDKRKGNNCRSAAKMIVEVIFQAAYWQERLDGVVLR